MWFFRVDILEKANLTSPTETVVAQFRLLISKVEDPEEDGSDSHPNTTLCLRIERKGKLELY